MDESKFKDELVHFRNLGVKGLSNINPLMIEYLQRTLHLDNWNGLLTT